MGSLSNYAETALLNHIYNTAYTPVSTLYLALCTADPTDTGTGAACNEVSNTNNYSRASISFAVASGRQVLQDANTEYATASGAWGNVTHWAIVDSDTYGSGNVLAYGAFVSSFSPVLGSQPVVDSGQVYVQLNTTVSGAGSTSYLVHKLLDLMFNNVAYTTPSDSVYLALFNSTCVDLSASTSDVTEVSGTGYARVKVNPNSGASPKWTTVVDGVLANNDIIAFPTTGAGGWTQVVCTGIVDASSGVANILMYDNNIPDQTPAENDIVRYLAGDLDITLS